MEERELNPFEREDEQLVANRFKLIMARKLKTIWADVLHEPLPRDLQLLLERLESGGESRSEPRASEETTGL
jgi:hypothetical protein